MQARVWRRLGQGAPPRSRQLRLGASNLRIGHPRYRPGTDDEEILNGFLTQDILPTDGTLFPGNDVWSTHAAKVHCEAGGAVAPKGTGSAKTDRTLVGLWRYKGRGSTRWAGGNKRRVTCKRSLRPRLWLGGSLTPQFCWWRGLAMWLLHGMIDIPRRSHNTLHRGLRGRLPGCNLDRSGSHCRERCTSTCRRDHDVRKRHSRAMQLGETRHWCRRCQEWRWPLGKQC